MPAARLLAHPAPMGLTSPPHPGFQASLLTVARSHAWLPVTGELGSLEDHMFTVERAAADRARWAVEQGDKLPQDFAPHLETKQAYAAPREGEIGQDGALGWQGKRWALRQAWDGAHPVARLEPLST